MDSAGEILDLRGLKCPLPALFARRALVRLSKGASVSVMTDDPLAPVDIPHMCHQEGYEVIKAESSDAGTTLVLRRP
jgi:tRNA 2-thiouridine synthesizing protein A